MGQRGHVGVVEVTRMRYAELHKKLSIKNPLLAVGEEDIIRWVQ